MKFSLRTMTARQPGQFPVPTLMAILLCAAPVQGQPDDSQDTEIQERSIQVFKGDLDEVSRRCEQLPLNGPLKYFHRFHDPPSRSAAGGLLDTSLRVRYGRNRLYNPASGRNVDVWLRSYEGMLVGPTLKVRPGDVLRVHMKNELCPNRPPSDPDNINVPHGFNTTNLHTHGLHVSPSGNSDNILVSIEPGQDFVNEIYVPRDHPAGTFWYHAHVHGSTAIQVSSGMTGALIIQGGMDDVVKVASDRTFVLQQMPYRQLTADPCERPAPSPEKNTSKSGTKHRKPHKDWSDLFGIEDYSDFGPGAWERGVVANGWRTTINGQTWPVVEMRPGSVDRWRFIHAGVREGIELCLLPVEEAVQLVQSQQEDPVWKGLVQLAGELAKLREGTTAWNSKRREISAYRRKPENRESLEQWPGRFRRKSLPLYEIAADGLAYGRVWNRDSVELFPGYRSDVLVKLNEAGCYCLIDLEASSAVSLREEFESPKLLSVITVRGERQEMPLPTDKELKKFIPHRPVTDKEITGQQKVEFNIDTSVSPPLFQVNSQAFDPTAAPRRLVLGKADEWILSSKLANHPFHIHVNPFEITSIQGPGGKELLPKDAHGKVRTLWKDTILVRSGFTYRVRSRYERYIGRFVLHCHILDHEDQGMMQLVEIVAPGNSGHGGHGH